MATPFLDIAEVEVTAGRGGKGCQSFHREPFTRHRRPTGGHGGDGGDVILQADPALWTLRDCAYRKHYQATHGRQGSSNHRQGARGTDCLVRVPVGTVVRDCATNHRLRDLAAPGEHVIVARGGRGGRGNGTGGEATPGEPGESRQLSLELKLLADVGLVGLPNAGKSSLLRRISMATPKVAAYPFTTTTPHLGVVTVPDAEETWTVCDIPGLIDGAHVGKGMGTAFLRHVERTRVLVYVLDMAGSEGRHPWQDFQTLQTELTAYAASVGEKPRLLVANKMDLPAAQQQFPLFQQATTETVYPISALTGEGIPALVQALAQRLARLNRAVTPQPQRGVGGLTHLTAPESAA